MRKSRNEVKKEAKPTTNQRALCVCVLKIGRKHLSDVDYNNNCTYIHFLRICLVIVCESHRVVVAMQEFFSLSHHSSFAALLKKKPIALYTENFRHFGVVFVWVIIRRCVMCGRGARVCVNVTSIGAVSIACEHVHTADAGYTQVCRIGVYTNAKRGVVYE